MRALPPDATEPEVFDAVHRQKHNPGALGGVLAEAGQTWSNIFGVERFVAKDSYAFQRLCAMVVMKLCSVVLQHVRATTSIGHGS